MSAAKCIFYDLKHSNNAARIRLWLRCKGIREEVVERRLLSNVADLRRPGYEEIHPGRKVPALVTSTGMQLFEGSVIMGYLEDLLPNITPNLILGTPDDRAFGNLLVRCHDLYVASPNCNQPNFSHTQGCMYLDPNPTPFTPERRTMTAAVRAAKLKELFDQLCWLESQARLPYLAGNLSHADLTWFPTFNFMEFMLPRSFGWSEDIFHETKHFPRLTLWYEHCLKDPEFQRVREEILEDHKKAYEKGRLSGVQLDVKMHPEYKWKYM